MKDTGGRQKSWRWAVEFWLGCETTAVSGCLQKILSTFRRSLNSRYFVHYTLKLQVWIGECVCFHNICFSCDWHYYFANNSHTQNSPVKFMELQIHCFILSISASSVKAEWMVWYVEHRELVLQMLLFLGFCKVASQAMNTQSQHKIT